MSYIRPLEGNAGLYIYPEQGGINFCSFPQHNSFFLPDECLDILLSRMSDEELHKRKKHGNLLLKSLYNNDYDLYKRTKEFNYQEDKNGRIK